MKCQSLKKNCRECGWKQDDKKLEKCAGCGADMHCGHDAVVGYTLCGNHGGPAPSRNFYGKGKMTVEGDGSSFNLKRLASSYVRQKKDGLALSLRVVIDTIDTRIAQLLERVDVGEAPDRVKKLYGLWEEFKVTTPGTTDHYLAKTELDATFEKVYHDYAAWNQIFDAFDLRGKSVEREIKNLSTIKAMMTAEDGYHLMAKAMAASMKVIGDDPKKLKELQYEYAKIIGESSDLTREGHAQNDWGSGETGGGEEGSGNVDQEELLHTRDEE